MMSEKALKLAKDEILRAIQSTYSDISTDEAQSLSEELLDAIDWDNSALMHKSIAWITKFYLQRKTR